MSTNTTNLFIAPDNGTKCTSSLYFLPLLALSLLHQVALTSSYT